MVIQSVPVHKLVMVVIQFIPVHKIEMVMIHSIPVHKLMINSIFFTTNSKFLMMHVKKLMLVLNWMRMCLLILVLNWMRMHVQKSMLVFNWMINQHNWQLVCRLPKCLIHWVIKSYSSCWQPSVLVDQDINLDFGCAYNQLRQILCLHDLWQLWLTMWNIFIP